MSVVGRAITPQLCGHGFRRPGAFEPLAGESGLGSEGAVGPAGAVMGWYFDSAPRLSRSVSCGLVTKAGPQPGDVKLGVEQRLATRSLYRAEAGQPSSFGGAASPRRYLWVGRRAEAVHT